MKNTLSCLAAITTILILLAGCKKAKKEQDIYGTWKLFKSEAGYNYMQYSEKYEKTLKCDGVNMKTTLECTNCSANGGVSQMLIPYQMTLTLTEDKKFVLHEESGSGNSEMKGSWEWTSTTERIKLVATYGNASFPGNVHFFLDSCTLSITELSALETRMSLYSVDARSDRSSSEHGNFVFRKNTTSTTTTLPPVTYGTMTDPRDGKTYKTVKIGSQTWMAENLKYAAPCAYAYNDDIAKVDTYGYLYSEAILNITPPAGWHIPTEVEVLKLIDSLGGDQVAARALKSTEKWLAPNDATNSVGFSMMPGGNGLINSVGLVDHYDNLNYMAHLTYIRASGQRGQLILVYSHSVATMSEAYDLSLFSVRYIKN